MSIFAENILRAKFKKMLNDKKIILKRYFRTASLKTYLFLLLFLLSACGKKQKKYEEIPYVYVNIEMTVIDLKPVNERGWDTIQGGYKGIILYKESASSYLAYERACPYDPLDSCSLVEVEPSGVTAIDSCCESRYLLQDGSVFSGPSLISLKRYHTYYDGTHLNIRN